MYSYDNASINILIPILPDFLKHPPPIHFVLAHIGPYTEKQNRGIQERGLWRLFQLSH